MSVKGALCINITFFVIYLPHRIWASDLIKDLQGHDPDRKETNETKEGQPRRRLSVG